MKEGPLAAIFVMLLSACQASQVGESKDETPAIVDAEAQFSRLEQRILQAETVHMKGSITSEGAVSSSITGTLEVSSQNRLDLDFNGEFAGNPVELHLLSDGDTMRGGSAAKSFELETPVALKEGILLGLTRMGILHNLAMLSGGAPPDGTDGGIQEWVQARNFSYDQATKAIRFEIVAGGTPSGEVELWLHETTGLPQRREQTVHFPEGDMHVEEIYERFTVTQ